MSRRVLRGFRPSRLVELREARGLKRPDLARIADVSLQTIHKWESGSQSPQIDVLMRVVHALSRQPLVRVPGADVPVVEREGDVSLGVGRGYLRKVLVSDLVDIEPEDRYPGDWRVIRGLTQPELGVRAGISTSMIGAIERGDSRLTDHFAEKLAAALSIPESELRASFERVRSRPPGTPA